MKVRCIDDSGCGGDLEKGKIYNSIKEFVHSDTTTRYILEEFPYWSYFTTRFEIEKDSNIDKIFEEKLKNIHNELHKERDTSPSGECIQKL